MPSYPALEIDGIVPIVPTPFNEDQHIAWDEFLALIEFAIGAGASAICLPAYASEFYKLSEDERLVLVSEAVRHAAGRLPVVGQVNYPFAELAAQMAKKCQQSGASAIAVSVPRQFALRERDLHRYFERILRSIEVTLIIQDFNPGGPSLTPEFIVTLNAQYPHFRYVKLEEPLMGSKVERIIRQTNGQVGVLEGWGGMYTLELARSGICGVMPGLALTDLLARTFRLAREGNLKQAYDIFQGVLPQIVFSLQNMELFHHAEKRLLKARGVLRQTNVRDASLELDPKDADHIDFLNAAILQLLDRLGMPSYPRHAA